MISMYMCMCMYVYIYIYIHVYTHTYTYTHTHTHMKSTTRALVGRGLQGGDTTYTTLCTVCIVYNATT